MENYYLGFRVKIFWPRVEGPIENTENLIHGYP